MLIASACHFKSPSIHEQQELIAKGAFPSGIPPWVAPAALNRQPGKRLAFGIVGDHSSSILLPQNQFEVQNIQSIENINENKKPLSALDRIALICPTLERQTNDALITVKPEERIRKFEYLVRVCQRSEDLWLWLGESYLQQDELIQAKRCFERVLMLDNNNQAARTHLNNIRL
jgi:tetratricopeptide (TPR) repeat protein